MRYKRRRRQGNVSRHAVILWGIVMLVSIAGILVAALLDLSFHSGTTYYYTYQPTPYLFTGRFTGWYRRRYYNRAYVRDLSLYRYRVPSGGYRVTASRAQAISGARAYNTYLASVNSTAYRSSVRPVGAASRVSVSRAPSGFSRGYSGSYPSGSFRGRSR